MKIEILPVSSFCVILSALILFSCESRGNDAVNKDGKRIIDTLKYGSYFKDLGIKDKVYFRIYDALSDTLISHVQNGKSYNVRFEVPRLKDLKLNVEVGVNGLLTELDDGYELSVQKSNESDYMLINFYFDLDGDSILIHNRNWTDSAKTAYEENYVGFKPRGTFGIKIKEPKIRI